MIGRAAFRVLWIVVLMFLVLPILIVVVLSFSSASYLTFPPPGLGIRWYRAYLGSSEWLASTWLSLGVAG
jgi:putative spermidine/putrescine transport system permease protein